MKNWKRKKKWNRYHFVNREMALFQCKKEAGGANRDGWATKRWKWSHLMNLLMKFCLIFLLGATGRRLMGSLLLPRVRYSTVSSQNSILLFFFGFQLCLDRGTVYYMFLLWDSNKCGKYIKKVEILIIICSKYITVGQIKGKKSRRRRRRRNEWKEEEEESLWPMGKQEEAGVSL